MKKIKRKLVASVLTIAFLFTGFNSVQAAEVKTGKPTTTTIGLTWEVWNKDYPSVGFRGWMNSLMEPMYGDSVFPKTINTMMTTYDEYYTYAVVIKEEDFLKMIIHFLFFIAILVK
jgi:hypothetical protein